MPQGKGTYGSKVGRPSKKNKYQGGGVIEEGVPGAIEEGTSGLPSPFPSAGGQGPEGVLVQKAMEAAGEESAIPMADARERSESYQLGGAVKPPTSPSIVPQQSYEVGGKVDVTDIVKSAEKRKAAQDVQEKLHKSKDWSKKDIKKYKSSAKEKRSETLKIQEAEKQILSETDARERRKYKKGGGVKTGVQKSPKYQGAPISPGKKSKPKEAEREIAGVAKKPTYKITGITKPKKKGLKPAKVPSNPPLIPHYGAKGRSSVKNLITDSVHGAGASKKKYKKGGKVFKPPSSIDEKTRKLNYKATEASIKRTKEKSLAKDHAKFVNPYKRPRDKDKK